MVDDIKKVENKNAHFKCTKFQQAIEFDATRGH